MTRADYLACDDPAAMLAHLRPSGRPKLVSDRRLRLWCVASALASSFGYTGPLMRYWLYGERSPDCADDEPIARATQWADCDCDNIGDPPMAFRAAILRDVAGDLWRHYAWSAIHDARPSGHEYQFLDERWRTPAVRALAEDAWTHADEKSNRLDPLTLLALADALEEAGCSCEEVLRHLRGQELCRGCSLPGREQSGWCAACDRHTDGLCWVPLPAPHVRGCWAVELVRGGE